MAVKEALIAAIAEWPSSSSIRSLFAHTKKESRPWISLIQTAAVSLGILASQVICFNGFHYRSLWFSSFFAHLCVCLCWSVLWYVVMVCVCVCVCVCRKLAVCLLCCSVSVLPTHENYNTRLAILDGKYFGHLCECLCFACVWVLVCVFGIRCICEFAWGRNILGYSMFVFG